MVNGDYEQALECYIPERKEAELRRADGREDFLKGSQRISSSLQWIQIMAKKILSNDKVELKITVDVDLEKWTKFTESIAAANPGKFVQTNPPPDIEVVPFIKNGNEWKANTGESTQYDAKWDADGQIQTFMP